MTKLEKAKVIVDPERRREIISTEAKNLAFAQGYELIEDDGLLVETAGLVEWPVVLMGSFDDSFLDDPAGSDPHHHPQQPEMLRGARSENREAGAAVYPGLQHGGDRRRQGNRRRQRARDPRAVVGREILLRDRSEEAAGRPAAEIRADRVSPEARHPGRTHRADRAAGRPAGADGRVPIPARRNARRCSPRPIC